MKYVDQAAVDWIEGEGYRTKVLLREGELNSPGTLVQIVELPPGAAVANHHHESCSEVFHILSGMGNFEIDGRRFDLRVGDTLTCEPGEIHNTRNPHAEPLAYVVFKTNVTEDDFFWD